MAATSRLRSEGVGTLVHKVRRTMAARGLMRPGATVVVGCSGGPDSVALLHALHRLAPELGLVLCVASVDHGLRPEAADEVRQVGRLAEGLALRFVPLRVVVEGPNLQSAARAARYQALLGLARAEGASSVAVGHTLDDQAETVLARVLRGAGITGLSGIEPARADGVIRPLIDCTRDEVRAYVTRYGLAVIEDPSNRDTRFTRVRLREDTLPRLEAEDPQVRLHLARLADEARELSAFVRAEAERALAGCDRTEALPLALLDDLPGPVRKAALRAFVVRVTGRVPGRAHLDDIDRLCRAPGEVLLPSGFRALRDGNVLRVQRTTKRRARSERHT